MNKPEFGTKTEVFLHREPLAWGSLAVHIRQTTWTPDNQVRAYAKPIEVVPIADRDMNMMVAPAPAWIMADEQAQQLIDELWRIGFRPTDGFGTAGHLGAMTEHLNDLRRLVFKDFKEEK